jgi:dienelactone hydrolase
VRGSTGYGRRYAALDDRERRRDAIADAVTVGEWLAARGDIDARRLAVGGASYGGYLALCALVAAPRRWAAGVTSSASPTSPRSSSAPPPTVARSAKPSTAPSPATGRCWPSSERVSDGLRRPGWAAMGGGRFRVRAGGP